LNKLDDILINKSQLLCVTALRESLLALNESQCSSLDLNDTVMPSNIQDFQLSCDSATQCAIFNETEQEFFPLSQCEASTNFQANQVFCKCFLPQSFLGTRDLSKDSSDDSRLTRPRPNFANDEQVDSTSLDFTSLLLTTKEVFLAQGSFKLDIQNASPMVWATVAFLLAILALFGVRARQLDRSVQ